MLCVVGQRARDPEGVVLAPGAAIFRGESTFGLLRKPLRAAGMTLADVVRSQTRLIARADYQQSTAVPDRHLGAIRPASRLFEVSGPVRRGCRGDIILTAIKLYPTS